MSLIAELLENEAIGPQVDSLTAIPAKGGRFEVVVNDHLIYSKLDTGRHAEPGEIQSLITTILSST